MFQTADDTPFGFVAHVAAVALQLELGALGHMNLCEFLTLLVTASLIIHQVHGGDKTLGTLRHLGRHVPGRAVPPAGPAPILESKEAKTPCEVYLAIPSNSPVTIRAPVLTVTV